jgi:hypothetical protein
VDSRRRRSAPAALFGARVTGPDREGVGADRIVGEIESSRPWLNDCAVRKPQAARAFKVGLKAKRIMKPYPTYRQREVLQFLMSGDWVPILRLIAVGERLLDNLLQVGWIERSPEMTTSDLYRITEAGRTAFKTPVPLR